MASEAMFSLAHEQHRGNRDDLEDFKIGQLTIWKSWSHVSQPPSQVCLERQKSSMAVFTEHPHLLQLQGGLLENTQDLSETN